MDIPANGRTVGGLQTLDDWQGAATLRARRGLGEVAAITSISLRFQLERVGATAGEGCVAKPRLLGACSL
jgi:hypothetical protein